MAEIAAETVSGSHVISLPSIPASTAVTDFAGLPSGLPSLVDSPLAWTGQQFENSDEHIHRLSTAELQEVAAALEHFKALELDGDAVCRDNFPLPQLGPQLEGLSKEIHDGRGFALIRGLDSREHSAEDLTVIYLGLQSYIANRQGRQDKKGNMLVHIVADSSSQAKAEHHRHSTAPIAFHTEESGDIVGWLTRSTAASGGKCIIASAYTAYNVLAATRPDLIRTLARSDWPFSFPRFQCRPVIFYHEQRLIMNFGRAALMGSASNPRPADLPGLSSIQVEALDAIESIAKATQLEMQTMQGDIHFINNLAVLHRREGFVNGPASDQRRHLVRMRLRDDALGWAIPEDLTRDWTRAFDDTGLGRFWHPEPMPDGYFPLRSFPN